MYQRVSHFTVFLFSSSYPFCYLLTSFFFVEFCYPFEFILFFFFSQCNECYTMSLFIDAYHFTTMHQIESSSTNAVDLARIGFNLFHIFHAFRTRNCVLNSINLTLDCRFSLTKMPISCKFMRKNRANKNVG